MIPIGIVAVITFLVIYWREVDTWASPAMATISGLLRAIFLGMLTLMIVVIVSFFFEPDTYSEDFEFPIVAAADGTAVEGSFFLFGGSIGQDPYYFFYRQDPDGAIRQGRIPVDQSKIFEDTENEGRIVVFREDEIPGSPLWILPVTVRDHKYEVHVPPGSVLRQFEFDLN